MNPRILLVEDEDAIVAGLTYALQKEGFEVEVARDGEAGLNRLRAAAFDLVLLDIMMPKRSGFDVLRALRKEGRAVRVILLTAKGQEADKVQGLDLGADDYVTKPFGLAELLARIRARLRRVPEDAVALPDTITLGPVRIELKVLRVDRGQHSEALTVKEADILRLLWRERGKAVSRRHLLQEVWKLDHLPATRTVDQTIARLRQKVEVDASRPRHIVTVFGVGYRLDV
jgi:DNA-binding response OmpR family regulator